MSARVRHLILNRIPDARTLSRTQLSLSPSAPVAIGGADLSFAARAAGWSRSGTPSGSIPAASATAPRCRSGQRTADCGLRTADCGLRTADCGLRTADCGLQGFPSGVCGSGIWSAGGASRSTMQPAVNPLRVGGGSHLHDDPGIRGRRVQAPTRCT